MISADNGFSLSSQSLVSNGLSFVRDPLLARSKPGSQRAKVVHIGTMLLQDEQDDPNLVLDLFALVCYIQGVKLTVSLIALLKTDTPSCWIWRRKETVSDRADRPGTACFEPTSPVTLEAAKPSMPFGGVESCSQHLHDLFDCGREPQYSTPAPQATNECQFFAESTPPCPQLQSCFH